MSEKPSAYVVEDNPDQYIIFCKALEAVGYEVEGAIDGSIAQQRLNEIIPDLIILDLHMPNVTGEVLLHQIKSDQRLRRTRVWLATADALLAKELRNEADMVLLKPISFMQLQQLSQRVIGRPKD